MPGTLIATQGDENWVLSPDGAYIYVAGNDGNLRVFDARTGESLYSVDLGIDLGAISLSPDGTRLAVVEEVPENVRQFQNWTENSADVSLYIVNLSTFAAQELTYRVTAEGYTFADVTWTDNDTLQLSQNILPGWSGWAPLATIELATGALTEHSSYYSGLGTSASLLTIPDSNTVLLGQLGLSSADYFLIGPDGNALATNGTYANDVYGYAGGIEAASGTTASDRIVIVTGGGAHLYDGTMKYIGNLASMYPNLGYASGVTFSADGQRLFFLDSMNKSVVVVDAYNYFIVATVALTDVVFETLKWGDEIVVAPDGNGVFYNTTSGIAYVSIDLPDLGTDGNDQLFGTAADDIIDGRAGADSISGLAGDDWLIGGAGNDTINGGDGFDIASYETATGGVNVDLGIAVAQAAGGGADSDTLVSIEGLSGSIYNDALTGNAIDNLLLGYDGDDTLRGLAGDDDLYGENGNDQLFGGAGVDWLFGDAGNDLLDGGTGADRLEGGDGNDTYVVDDAGDTVLETATGGIDTMQVSNVNATIASSVEALIITSGAVNATGNFAANSLTGSDQANVLSGLGGNDTLIGGGGNDTLIGGSGFDTLTGGAGADTFRDTAADLNGDTITDFGAGDRIVISNANLAGFSFSLSGNTLTYNGGSLTFSSPVSGTLVARAAIGGGVQLFIGGNQFSPADVAMNAFGSSPSAGGWTSNNVFLREVADVNGDNRADIVAFGQNATYVSLGNADGTFAPPTIASAQFTGEIGWANENRYPREMADVNGDGRADMVGFGEDGVYVALANADGSFAAATMPLRAFGAGAGAGGWTSNATYLREMADVNGDGRADIVAFGQSSVYVAMANADGTFAAPTVATTQFTSAFGWGNEDRYPRALADVNGDGRADIVGFGEAGVYVALANANGTFATATLPLREFGAGASAGGWTSNDQYVRTLADVNGDGRADIVAFGQNSVFVSLSNADGSFTDHLGSDYFTGAAGWTSNVTTPRVLADINGDGADDIIGFGVNGVYVALSNGDVF